MCLNAPFFYLNRNIMHEQNQIEEQEIDILALIKRLWEKKTFIIKVTIVFAFIGLFVAISSPNVYTSSCIFVPQTSKKSSGGGLSSLAALAGISLGDMGSGETLSPVVYPQILENIDFKKDLMYSKIKFQDYDEPIALIDYFTNPKYAKFNLISTLKKYTIGLPFTILKSLKSQQDAMSMYEKSDSLKSYTEEEFKCAEILGKCISMTLEDKKGFITISASLGEPIAAAQLCQVMFDLLQKYVTDFKIMKAQNQLSFINNRYEETKVQFEEKQKRLASFMDANKVISSAQARVEQDKLTAEYNLANTIYSEMARQRLQAEIQVKEDTPILTAVKPVVVPFKKSKPQRAKILIIWCFMGIVFGGCAILGGDWLREQNVNNKILDKYLDSL